MRGWRGRGVEDVWVELPICIFCFQRDVGKLGCGQKKVIGQSKHASSLSLKEIKNNFQVCG